MKRKHTVWLATALVVGVAVWIGSAYAAGSSSGLKPEKRASFALVDGAGGTLGVHSKDVLSSATTGTGTYTVTLKGNIEFCAPTATLENDSGTGIGEINTETANSNVITVTTYNSSGTAQDHSFFLTVLC